MRLVILQNGVAVPFSTIDGNCVVELTDIYLQTAELNEDDDLLLTMNDATTHLVPLSSVYMRDFRLPVVTVLTAMDVATMQINEVDTSAGIVNFLVPAASLYEEGEIIIFRRNGANTLNLNAFGPTTINGIGTLSLTEDYRVVWFTKRGNDWTAIADYDEAGGGGGGAGIFTLEANGALWGANTATIAGNARGARAVDVQGYRTAVIQVASGDDSVAVGNETTASSTRGIAIGRQAGVSGTSAVALGANAVGASANTVVVGYGANIATSSDRSIVIGLLSQVPAFTEDAIAVGANTISNQPGSVVIGTGAYGGANLLATESGVAIGRNASIPPNSPGGIVIGDGANLVATPYVDSPGRIAIGESAKVASGTDNAIAVGTDAYAFGGNPSLAIGGSAQANSNSIAIGPSANASAGSGIVIGGSATDSGATQGVVIGNNASGVDYYSTVIGDSASGNQSGVTIGYAANLHSVSSILIGPTRTTGYSSSGSVNLLGNIDNDAADSISIGNLSGIGQYSPASVAIGHGANVAANTQKGIAIGDNPSVNGEYSIAIGSNTGIAVGATASIVIGKQASITGTVNNIAIGAYSSIGPYAGYATVVGANASVGANADYSTAIGTYANVNHVSSIVIGPLSSTAANQVSIGHADVATGKIVLESGQLTVPALDVNGHITENVTTTSTGSNYVINMSVGTVWAITLTGSITISFSNVLAGRSCTVNIIQGGAGSYTVAWTGVTWPGGTPPTLSTAIGSRDKLVFDSYNGAVIDGSLAGLNYS